MSRAKLAAAGELYREGKYQLAYDLLASITDPAMRDQVEAARKKVQAKLAEITPTKPAPPVMPVQSLPPVERHPLSAEVLFARQRSFTNQAVIVFVLYWLFFIPGLIANWMFLDEARRAERMAGQALPGVGALRVMNFLAVFVGLGLAVLAGCAIAGMIAPGLLRSR